MPIPKQAAQVQTIAVKDRDDDWVNRLAVITATLKAMSAPERGVALQFINTKFGVD